MAKWVFLSVYLNILCTHMHSIPSRVMFFPGLDSGKIQILSMNK